MPSKDSKPTREKLFEEYEPALPLTHNEPATKRQKNPKITCFLAHE